MSMKEKIRIHAEMEQANRARIRAHIEAEQKDSEAEGREKK